MVKIEPMKRILLALVMICGSAIAVEYGNFWITPSNSIPSSITLNDGDCYICLGQRSHPLIVSHPSSGSSFTNWYTTDHRNPDQKYHIITGPAIISPDISVEYDVLLLPFKIIRASETESSASPTPLNIISLPADNNGDLDLLIETSTDLQSWTPIYSDSIGTTGTASFIRTRLIND